MNPIAAIILAAGKSKRMKTKTPKALHPIMGKPLIDYVLDACKGAGVTKTIMVVGHEKEMVMSYLGDRVEFTEQKEQLGTGHAVMQAMPCLEGFEGQIMILCGDMPLLSPETLSGFIKMHREENVKISLLTAVMDQPGKLGRIIRAGDGSVEKIVEAADASPQELAVKEVNTGTYIFQAAYLREILPSIGLPNAQKEIYLTDTIALSREKGVKVFAMSCPDYRESLGVNSRIDLAEAAKVIRRRINEKLMASGVTLYDPDNTYIENEVEIGPDTTILPGCMLLGKTVIGEDCTIGPHCRITDSTVGDGSRVTQSVIIDSKIGPRNEIGPFAHVRPKTSTGENCKVGNFVETKKSSLGNNTKASHLTYLGDATVGNKVNIGAGTITCNYDGSKKNPTVIKDNAFIGSNSMLIAPVEIGEGSRTGASSVVTKNIPDWSLAVGMPARRIKTLKKPE